MIKKRTRTPPQGQNVKLTDLKFGAWRVEKWYYCDRREDPGMKIYFRIEHCAWVCSKDDGRDGKVKTCYVLTKDGITGFQVSDEMIRRFFATDSQERRYAGLPEDGVYPAFI